MRLARALHALGELLITAGLVILLFVAYELWFTGLQTAREQTALAVEIHDVWERGGGLSSAPEPSEVTEIPIGTGIAILRVPRFGSDWAQVVVEGVDLDDLKRGPGHYPGTQLPGQVGNFVVSGHRTTYGAPFNRVDELRDGDPIVVETRDTWFTYRVTTTRIVRPSAIEVTWPVPGQQEATPAKALLTITSCHPKYSARERIIVHAELSDTAPKSAGPPAALRGS